MQSTIMRIAPRNIRSVIIFGVIFCAASGCASFKPVPLEQIPFRERAQTLEKDDLKVTVSVLSRAEAREAFGVNLQKRGIQPVWLEIENRTDKRFWFMMSSMDPEYFSAHEAAYMNHYWMGGKTNKEMDAYFSELAIDQNIEPGETRSGFAFTNETVGTKEIRVRLFSDQDLRNFEFFMSVPGVQSDWERIDLEGLYEPGDLLTVESDEDLNKAIEALPCCTQRFDGSGEGVPVNIAMVGARAALKAFIKAGWDETAFRDTPFTFFGANYLFGRVPDVQFQKTRRRIDTEILVRLWLSPIVYRGERIWVGSVANSVDPLVDESAVYVIEDLGTARTVSHYGVVQPSGDDGALKTRTTPTGQAYLTRGERFVMKISEAPVRLDEIQVFDWEWDRDAQKRSSTAPAGTD